MVYVGEDKVLLFGGHHGGSSISSETWVYDLSDGEWTLKNPANGPAARYDHGMARIGADKALVFSGVIGTGGGGGVTDAETWVYDLSDNTWTPMSPPSTPPRRYGHAMASLGGDKVAPFGGYGPSGGQYGAPLDDTWVYDLSEDAWSEYTESPYPSARFGHTFCETSTDGSRSVVMFGGAQDWLENDLSLETWIFDF